jgi:5-methylthioadenosine/S-adenosylhomocysteine deaminase
MAEYVVVRGARVLSAATRTADHCDILIKDDTIEDVGPPGIAAPVGASVVDARNRLLIPGLINSHTHSHANVPRGIGDRWTLELALNTNPAIRGLQSAEEKYIAAQLGAAEMLSKGCTACYDLFYEFPEPTVEGLQAVAQGYADAGMRAVVAPLISSISFYKAVPGLMAALPEHVRSDFLKPSSGSPAERSLAITREALRNWKFDRSRARLAVAPHSPLHSSDEFFVSAHRLAQEFGVGLQTHLAESKVQAVCGLSTYGKSLTAHLVDLGVLGPHFTAGHGVWLDDDDMKRLGDAGASVSHNPASNMRYGNGLAAVRRMLDFGVNVGIGTDSRSCSDNLNMFEAMRLASFTSRVQGPDYNKWLATDEVLRMATRDSAKALGLGDTIGTIAKGYKADIVFLDLDNLNYVPLNSAINQVVNAEEGTGVASVMVGGRMVYEGGRVTTVDLARLRSGAQATMDRLRSTNGQALELAQRLEGVVGSFCVGLSQRPYHVHRYSGGH